MNGKKHGWGGESIVEKEIKGDRERESYAFCECGHFYIYIYVRSFLFPTACAQREERKYIPCGSAALSFSE